LWFMTEWPDGPTMITFTALSVILFSARAEAAFSSAVEFAIGCAGASVVAVILNLAVLPAVPSDFLSLAVVLFLVMAPLGALAAGSWHKAAFVGMATNVMPILAIQNQPSYEASRALNVALAVCAGTAMAAIAIRLVPPLSSATRIQRLLALTLQDLRNLLKRRQRLAPQAWIGRITRRLEAMPKQATLEEEAHLLAALSIGEAAIALLESRSLLSAGGTLDQAFAELVDENVEAAREKLDLFCAEQPVESAQGVSAAVQAAVIADALQRHPRFFSRLE